MTRRTWAVVFPMIISAAWNQDRATSMAFVVRAQTSNVPSANVPEQWLGAYRTMQFNSTVGTNTRAAALNVKKPRAGLPQHR